MTKTRFSSAAALLITAVVAGGCSNGAAHLSPLGPTPTTSLPPAAAAFGDRSAASGTVVNDRGTMSAWANGHGFAVAVDDLMVEGSDAIMAISGSCPAATITIRNVPVTLTATTTFASPLSCATLTAGTVVRVMGVLTVSDTGFAVTATHIGVSATPSGGSTPPPTGGSTPPGGSKKERGEGTIGAITGSCPTLTLIITGTRVQTTAATQFVNGSCESLRPGTKVKIEGGLNPGGTATAESIEVLRTPGRPVSGDGKVDRVAGTCPALTMTVRGVAVTTDAATTFSGGSCSSIVAGTQVDVTGEYDGTSLAATAVAIKHSGRS